MTTPGCILTNSSLRINSVAGELLRSRHCTRHWQEHEARSWAKMYASKMLLPSSLIQSTKLPVIYKEGYLPVLPNTCRYFLKKKQCDTSAQCNKNSGSSKQQLSVWKGGKMPSRLSFNDFGLSLASSSICDVWNSKTTRRQLSDASSAVGSTPGKTVGDILKVKGERFYRIKVLW